MAINRINQSGHMTYGLRDFVIDAVADLDNLPIDIPMGSTAKCIANGITYILNGEAEWVEKKGSASSGGGSVTVPTKLSEFINDTNFVADANYVHTDSNYTADEKAKLAELSNYDDTAVKQRLTALEGQECGEAPYDFMEQVDEDGYLYETVFSKLDESFAKEYFANAGGETPGACSAVRKGNLYGRNFDWTYDDSVEFIIHTPRIGSKNATLGVSGSLAGLDKEFVASGEYSETYKVIPFRMVDGINEHGMVMNTNVVPNQKSEDTFATPRVEMKYELPASMMVFYVLSNFNSVDNAVAYLRDYVKIVIPQSMLDQDFFLHWMLADANKTVLLEIIDGELVITDMTPNSNSPLAGKSYLTNFYLSDVTFNYDGTVWVPANNDETHNPITVNNITSHGAGLERYNIIKEVIELVEDKDDMRELLKSIYYTNAYQNNMGGNWYSEFVGLMDLDLASPVADFETAFPYAMGAFENRSRGDGTWQTTHSCIYDMEAGQLFITSQQQETEYEFNIELKKPVEASASYTAGYGIIIDNNNKISVDEVDISTVEYVDANISDTMNFIIQERDSEHAGRVAGDNLLQAAINNKQDILIAGTGISIAEDGKTISATGGGNGGGDSSIISIGEAIQLVCSVEDPWAEEVTPDDVFYSCDINASAIPNDFWVHPSRYNFIVTIESTDSTLWGYTANHFCYMLDNYEGNWGITAVCEDNINQLNVKHDTTITKDTSEDVIHIVYQGFLEDSPSLPVDGNICSVFLQKFV